MFRLPWGARCRFKQPAFKIGVFPQIGSCREWRKSKGVGSILRAISSSRARSLAAARKRLSVHFAFRLPKNGPTSPAPPWPNFEPVPFQNLLLLVSLINVPAPQRALQTPVESKSGWGVGPDGA